MSIKLKSDFSEEVLRQFHQIELSKTEEIQAFVDLVGRNPEWHRQFTILYSDPQEQNLTVLFKQENHLEECRQQMPLAVRRMEAMTAREIDRIVTEIYAKSPAWQRQRHLK
jgi:hypothetical protein